MSMTHIQAQGLMHTARNRTAGKPLENNTRLYGDPGSHFDIKYHNTYIVTIHTDGTYTLRNGGYNTSTTLERVRRYSPAKLFTEKGDWFVWMKETKRDPRPAKVERSIPKPFTPGDHPGPEPIKTTEDCVAGQLVTTEHVNEVVELWRKDVLDGEEIIKVVSDGHEPGGDYDRVQVKRTWNSHIYIGEAQHGYQDEGWRNLDDNHNVHDNRFVNDDGETVKYTQCSHCTQFDAEHRAWTFYMNGERWAAIDQRKGYRLYAEMMEHFDNDMDAWQEAYIADFRARREYNKADREWEVRNRVPFYDGIKVDSEGWAERVRQTGPSPAKLRRHEKEVERTKKRIDKYAAGYMKVLLKGMPVPSNGDCWHCLIFDAVPRNEINERAYVRGATVEPGDPTGNEHLFSHMDERYYVPSLIVNALRHRGYSDTAVAIHLAIYDPESGTMGGPRVMADSVKRELVRYLRKRLVPQPPTA